MTTLPLVTFGLLLSLMTPTVAGAADVDPDDHPFADVEITREMTHAATIPLDADSATLPLDGESSAIPVEVTVEEEEQVTRRLTSDVLFAFDSADLSAEARDAIAGIAGEIPQGAAVSVDGHTDSVGDAAYNDDLSLRRAEAVASVLREARPDLTLTVAGHGERQPLADEAQGGAPLNRRVDISYAAG